MSFVSDCIDHINNLVKQDDIFEACKQFLNTCEFKVTKYDYEILEGAGMMGAHAILNIQVKLFGEDKELSFFLKVYPHFESSVQYAKIFKPFRREINIYGLFANMKKPSLGQIIPQCYYMKDDSFLVLENLQLQGFCNCPKTVDDVNIMKRIVWNLAILHAASVTYETSKGSDYCLLQDYSGDLREHFFNDLIPLSETNIVSSTNGVLKALELFNLPQHPQDTIAKLFRKLYNLVKPSKTTKNVFCHGDLYPSNILLAPDQSCKFVDFQFSRYAPPACELLSVIYLTTRRCFRKQHLSILVEGYYQTLTQELQNNGIDGAKVFPKNTFMESCEEYKACGILLSLFYLPVIMLENEDLKALMEDSEMCNRIFKLDKSAAFNFARINKDEYFERLRDAIDDIQELLV